MTTRPVDTASTGDLTEVFYPETDGMPLPDGYFQDPIFREVISIFELYYIESPTTAVSGNTIIYYEEGNPRRMVSPDCYVAFDVSMESIERFNTYRNWEVGKPPDFVLEIGSPSTANTDLVRKRQLYAELGIGEYWRFDSTGGNFYREPLVGERLVDGEYQRLEMGIDADGRVRGHSDVLDLDICWEDGHLRAYDPADGRWLPNYHDVFAQADAMQAAIEAANARTRSAEERIESARARAEAAEERIESAKARAEAAEERIESAKARARSAEERIESARARAEVCRGAYRVCQSPC